jgi:hypothetical protein
MNDQSSEFLQFECKELNFFKPLFEKCKLESICPGRYGAISVEPREKGTYPIVRTTSQYHEAPTFFTSEIKLLRHIVQTETKSSSLDFNNAMVEMYDYKYYKMGKHTDITLDLEDNSWICLFTCYNHPNPKPQDLRLLRTYNKITQKEESIVLKHNFFVLFSTKTNQTHVHHIVLPTNAKVFSFTKWLGVTMRMSKTFVQTSDKIPMFVHLQKPLRLATAHERTMFNNMKHQENTQTDFIYPYSEIDFCLSPSDFFEPK